MAFNFPASPTVGQIFTPAAGVTYVWSGTSWDRQGSAGGAASMPAGVVVPFAGSIPPVGTLLCDGKAISRVSYPTLFAAIGTTWGAGDGSTTFNLPDMRGRAPFGRDDMGGTVAGRLSVTYAGFDGKILGASGGNQALQAHAHPVSGTTDVDDRDHQHLVNGTSSGDSPDHAHYVSVMTDVDTPDHTHNVTGSNITNTTATGGNSRIQWAGAFTSGGANARHQHAVNTWSGGASARHTHTLNFWSGGRNTGHLHTFSATSGSTGVGGSQNVPPAAVLNYIIFTGA